MASVEKVSVSLTPEMAAVVRQVVEAGEYASASEVVREALRDWKLRRARRERAIEEIGRLWDVGMAGGASADGEQAFVRLGARLETKLADHDQS
jgi:antitoxin ParD1/3/4